MFCPNCGNQNNVNNDVCLYCGTRLKNNNVVEKNDDKSNVGLNILSFFVPLIGVILYFLLKKEQPVKAKNCCKSAIIGVVVFVILCIVLIILSGNAINSSINKARKDSLSFYSKEINSRVQSQYYNDKIYGNIKNCYTISELYNGDSDFEGSVSVKEDGAHLNIKMWVTYDDVSMIAEYDNTFKVSEEFYQDSKVNLTCRN